MSSQRGGAFAVTCLLFLAGCRTEAPFHGDVVSPPIASPRLIGTNWDGEAFDLAQLEGKVAIVLFGYTYCPDVCPFALAKMQRLYGQLEERAEDVAVVFVSVDPHRDTVDKLARYVPNFDRRFYGLHVDTDQLDVARSSFDLTVQYSQPKDGPRSDSFYFVDHTGTYFVVDREGRLRLKYSPSSTAEEMVPDIERLLVG